MAQHIRPAQTSIKVIPRDGAIEITLNINITVDGQVVTAQVAESKEEKMKEKIGLLPDFSSGLKLNFGKSC